MIKVEMDLLDNHEVQGFAQFVQNVEQYRFANSPAGKAQMMKQAEAKQEQIVAAMRETTTEAVDAKVIATISPESKPVTEPQMIEAIQAYMKVKGIPATHELVKKFGVAKASELKDQGARSELYAMLVEGAK